MGNLSNAQPLAMRGGDIISWDSRTTHGNTENKTSNEIRYVAYVSAGKAQEDDKQMIEIRNKAFQSGEGSNMRKALMHASKKPRYTDLEKVSRTRKEEKLTLLGRLLYGQEKYEKI